MRNRNIFIRKESEFSCLRGNGLPVFAHVLNYGKETDSVVYETAYVQYANKDVGWQYGSVYAKPLDEFLDKFSPDIWDEYSNYAC